MPHTPTPPAPTPARLLRINEVAAEIGLTTRTIRYYEEVGLLAPAARSDGDYRLYDASDLDRLRFIRDLRDDAGFSLAQIRQLLEDEAARERNRARLRATTDPVERREYLHEAEERILRQVALLDAKAARLAIMIDEAQARLAPSAATWPTSTPTRRRAAGAMTAHEGAAARTPANPDDRGDERVPPPQLPAVLRRPGDLARRDLDAAGRAGVAGPRR